jgi:hypothetical protein
MNRHNCKCCAWYNNRGRRRPSNGKQHWIIEHSTSCRRRCSYCSWNHCERWSSTSWYSQPSKRNYLLKLYESFVAVQVDLDSCLQFIKEEDNPQSEVALGIQDRLWFSVSNFTHFKATSKPWTRPSNLPSYWEPLVSLSSSICVTVTFNASTSFFATTNFVRVSWSCFCNPADKNLETCKPQTFWGTRTLHHMVFHRGCSK